MKVIEMKFNVSLFSKLAMASQSRPDVDMRLCLTFNEAAHKQKQMMTNCTKEKGATQDGYFDKEFRRAFEGDGSIDVIRMNRLSRLQKDKQILAGTFKPPSSPKKPCGLGSTFGTFAEYQGPIKAFSAVERGRELGVPVKRNIITNPGKKGTGYGYPNVTIGQMPPYLLEKDYEKLKNTTHETKKYEPKSDSKFAKPFIKGMRVREYFDPNPFFTDKPDLIYTIQKKEEPIEVPFVPSGCSKKDGGMKAGCFNAFPEYKENEYPRPELVGRGVKRYVNKEQKMFKPVPALKPYPIKSIIDTNIKKSINIQNFATTKGVVYCKK